MGMKRSCVSHCRGENTTGIIQSANGGIHSLSWLPGGRDFTSLLILSRKTHGAGTDGEGEEDGPFFLSHLAARVPFRGSGKYSTQPAPRVKRQLVEREARAPRGRWCMEMTGGPVRSHTRR